MPKSVAEALAAAIAAGDTPAEAAASAAALAKAQVEHGFAAPTGDALLQAANDVEHAYVAAGGTTARAKYPSEARTPCVSTETLLRPALDILELGVSQP